VFLRLDYIPENLSRALDKCVKGLPRDSTDWPKIVTQTKFTVPGEIIDESTLVARCARILLLTHVQKLLLGFNSRRAGGQSFLGRKN
jgi:hypothetical protein